MGKFNASKKRLKVFSKPSNLPIGLEDVQPLPYKFTADLEAFVGKVLIGETPLQRIEAFVESVSLGLRALTDLIENLTPIASVKEFIAQVGRCVSRADKPCDPMGVLLAGASVIVDVGATVFLPVKAGALAFKSFKPLYKVGLGIERTLQAASRAGVAISTEVTKLGTLMRTLTDDAIRAGANSLDAVTAKIKLVVGEGWSSLNSCRFMCIKKADTVLEETTRLRGDLKNGAKDIETELGKANSLGDSVGCFLNVAKDAIGGFTFLSQIGETILGFRELFLRQQARAKKTSIPCDDIYKKFKKDIRSKFPERYRDVPKDDLDKSAPHHITLRKENMHNNPTRCKDPISNIDICEESRSILDAVGIGIDDPCNGVLIPWVKNQTNQTYRKFGQPNGIYPNVIKHDTTNAGIHGFDGNFKVNEGLKIIRERFRDENGNIDPTRKEIAKAAICSKLQMFAQEILDGTFI
jgi:hypothetical protein